MKTDPLCRHGVESAKVQCHDCAREGYARIYGAAPAAKEDGIPEEPICIHGVSRFEACERCASYGVEPRPKSESVASLQEPEGELRHAMDSTIPFAELFERSKDDRAMIVGSEVREVIGAYRRCLSSLGDVEAELRKLRSQESK